MAENFRMKTIIQNLAVEYDEHGAGTVLLMLHGWKDTLHTFDALVPALSERHHVVRLDLPGFGGSDMPKMPWGLAEYVSFVKEFIQKRELNVDMLIGHSFGGRVVIKGVGSGILKPNRVVLISAAGLANRRTARNYVLSMLGKIGKFVTLVPPFSFWRSQLRRTLYRSIGSDYFAAGELKDTFVRVVGEDLASYAQKISPPTLIIWGENDDVTPLDQAERTHALIRGSVLRTFKGAGHFVHREYPNEVASAIKEFLI